MDERHGCSSAVDIAAVVFSEKLAQSDPKLFHLLHVDADRARHAEHKV
jgi:hypothetical protein